MNIEIKRRQPARKNSRQRAAILSVLRSTKSHPTAGWIYEQLKPAMPALSQATVYRNLGLLAEQGTIQVLRSGSGMDRYDADISLHYHLICTCCGKVDDVSLPAMQGLEQDAARDSGYQVQGPRTDVYGICPGCQKPGTH